MEERPRTRKGKLGVVDRYYGPDEIREDHDRCVPLTTHNRKISEHTTEVEGLERIISEQNTQITGLKNLIRTYRKELEEREAAPFQKWFQGIHPELFKTITVEFK